MLHKLGASSPLKRVSANHGPFCYTNSQKVLAGEEALAELATPPFSSSAFHFTLLSSLHLDVPLGRCLAGRYDRFC